MPAGDYDAFRVQVHAHVSEVPSHTANGVGAVCSLVIDDTISLPYSSSLSGRHKSLILTWEVGGFGTSFAAPVTIKVARKN